MKVPSDRGKGGPLEGPVRSEGTVVPAEGNGHARTLLLSDLLGSKVVTKSGAKLGKLKDFVFVDDPKYAEVTHLLVGRPYGDPSLKIPWGQVQETLAKELIVQDSSDAPYPEVNPEEDLLLLRDKIVDKRILDTGGFAVEVVYDIQLLLVEGKLFIVAADVSRGALMRRLGIGRLGRRLPVDGGLAGFIPWKYVQPLGADLTATKGDVRLTVTRERLGDIHPEDFADILEELGREDRIHLFNALDSKAAAATLEATEPRVQREILASTSSERVSQIFAHLSPVEISEVISILPKEDAEEFQKALPGNLATRVQELVTRHDVPASTLAVHRFLQFPGDLSVEDAFTRFRREAPTSLVTMYLYIADEKGRLKGVLDINELLQASPEHKLSEIMITNVVTVAPSTSRGEIESLFRRYRFRAIPVVGGDGKIEGVVREKDAFSTGDEIRLAR
jgi:CBS domain-containing protein